MWNKKELAYSRTVAQQDSLEAMRNFECYECRRNILPRLEGCVRHFRMTIKLSVQIREISNYKGVCACVMCLYKNRCEPTDMFGRCQVEDKEN